MTNNRSGFLSPAIFFTFDPTNSGFNRNSILDTLQGESIDVEVFQDFVIRNIEKKENILRGGSNLNSNNAFDNLNNANLNRNEYSNLIGNAEILEQQRREMEDLIRKEERQKREKAEEEKRLIREVTLSY